MFVMAGTACLCVHACAHAVDADLRVRVCAALEYLSCIFMSSLMEAVPWQYTWSAQVLSPFAWAQVALACDDAPMAVMRALHKAVRHVCSASLWSDENTMHVVYAIAHHQPCTQHTMVTSWLCKNAQSQGTDYRLHSTTLTPPFRNSFSLKGTCPRGAWCADMHLLRARATL